MTELITFSKEELDSADSVRKIYNSGKMREAYEAARQFAEANPESIMGKQRVAVMAGDYSYDSTLPDSERHALKEFAKTELSELYHHPERHRFPPNFRYAVQNEYYWFFEMHTKQYELGVERVGNGVSGGTYSMCVGASAEATRLLLKESKLTEAQEWAQKSLKAFEEFEKTSPLWYNINYFAADALAVLGREEEALATFKDMFRKQGSAISEAKVNEFQKKLQTITEARKLALSSPDKD